MSEPSIQLSDVERLALELLTGVRPFQVVVDAVEAVLPLIASEAIPFAESVIREVKHYVATHNPPPAPGWENVTGGDQAKEARGRELVLSGDALPKLEDEPG